MNDEGRRDDVTGDTPRERNTSAETPTHASRKSRLGLTLGALFIGLPALALAAWLLITVSWVYSRGERAGYIQKFSQKGWVCKTWEGDMAMSTIPGSAPERFAFTVRNDSVAQEITKLMGARVAISYEQHRGVPGSCFGETEYYVTAVKPVAGP